MGILLWNLRSVYFFLDCQGTVGLSAVYFYVLHALRALTCSKDSWLVEYGGFNLLELIVSGT